MSEFVIPPHSITHPDKPVVFLAGPVQGSYDWQLCAASRLSAAPVDITIVSPRGEPHIYKEDSPWLLDERKQIHWEKHHLRLARRTGVLAVWVAAQNYPTPGRMHNQTTRIEFGRIAGWLDYDPAVRFVFGIDPEYRGGNRTYFEDTAEELHLPIERDLDSWCDQIVSKLSS